uniref:Uncharacterized protein n=1 Tax=Knipowitschia caucasica TaxID=637954 RepID=A0AAV2K805_KNICA
MKLYAPIELRGHNNEQKDSTNTTPYPTAAPAPPPRYRPQRHQRHPTKPTHYPGDKTRICHPMPRPKVALPGQMMKCHGTTTDTVRPPAVLPPDPVTQ